MDGLAYAHRAELPVTLADGRTAVSHGLVHRDITPPNLLLTTGAGGGTVTKIADFGLAKAFDQAGLSGHTRTGAIGGSIAFQARTQLIDYKYARPEVDLWALTACLYWMLTGTTPRDFPAGTDPIAVVLRTRPVPVRQRLASVPPRLAAVIDEMLVDNPGFPRQRRPSWPTPCGRRSDGKPAARTVVRPRRAPCAHGTPAQHAAVRDPGRRHTTGVRGRPRPRRRG
ncbi:hypothetical protein GCM10027614_07030 [Micromonospora vulcania]